jgi:hypothetical protein
MKKHSNLKFVLALLVIAISTVWALRDRISLIADTKNTVGGAAKTPPPKENAPANGTIPVDTVLKVNPLGRAQSAPLIPAKPASPQSLTNEYLTQRNAAAIYARLLTEKETGETLRLKAAILARCGTRTDKPSTERDSPAVALEKFLATLPKDHPDNPRRIAAFNLMGTDPCVGFPPTPITGSEIDAMRTAAAEAGDPLSRARALECEIFANGATPTTGRYSPPPLSDEQFSSIKAIIASGDPNAVLDAGTLLANTYGNGTIRIGGSPTEVDSFALRYAVELVSCDLGAPCEGVNFPRNWSCAQKNKCDANNLSDYINFYEVSPHVAQEVERLRVALRGMIETKDFSEVRFEKGGRSDTSTSRWGRAQCKA